ncbi:MAG: hypothetical protein HYZ26_11875 [Chloroflexi bacterium]|nr:hypothetical protein [Chloroflexota bacterium]
MQWWCEMVGRINFTYEQEDRDAQRPASGHSRRPSRRAIRLPHAPAQPPVRPAAVTPANPLVRFPHEPGQPPAR